MTEKHQQRCDTCRYAKITTETWEDFGEISEIFCKKINRDIDLLSCDNTRHHWFFDVGCASYYPKREEVCDECKYQSQACAYMVDGRKFEDACVEKQRSLKKPKSKPKKIKESDLYLRPTPPEVINDGLKLMRKQHLTKEDYFREFTI